MSLSREVVRTACLGKNDLVPKATVHSTDNRFIEIEYATFGSSSNPAILMIMGYTAQMIVWPQDFCQQLADAGYYVIIFDNRDCGLSTHLDGVVVDTGPIIMAAMTDQPIPPIPYSLSDMATDAVGVLDHLGIERLSCPSSSTSLKPHRLATRCLHLYRWLTRIQHNNPAS